MEIALQLSSGRTHKQLKTNLQISSGHLKPAKKGRFVRVAPVLFAFIYAEVMSGMESMCDICTMPTAEPKATTTLGK
jgi:hypothetical protein